MRSFNLINIHLLKSKIFYINQLTILFFNLIVVIIKYDI